MPYEIDETHDPSLESWVESANDPETDFPIQNLPLCRFAPPQELGLCDHFGVRVGDMILDVGDLAYSVSLHTDKPGPAQADAYSAEDEDTLLPQLSEPLGRKLRARIQHLLSTKGTSEEREQVSKHMYSPESCEFALPATVRDYTDFYASVFHATNVGTMFRPNNPLLPNYKHIPIAYHGRASTVVASGTDIIRPCGQLAPAEEGGNPTFGPCKLFDHELEVGVVVGRGNELGEPIPIADAEDHILGLCLLNDWSARDLQKWEYQPLGPFLAKNFATSVSPYIVTMEALAPFRTPAYERPAGDPQPLGYLDSDHNRAHGGVDITLEVFIASEQMREKNMSPIRLSRGTFKDMYWTIAQMLTHHSSNGCMMQPGDLLGSGTVSGKARDSRGCMLELTWDGDAFADPPVLVPGTQRTPITLPTGEERKFLADGDEVIIKGFCEREGYRRIGFGECRGTLRPARAL
ncbi:MAG: fumarylacetoacetase [Phycisphaeraceae bacterium]|nr:MAG: fumarylacetoacetase [Phycisphaeraceae bacterium]